MSENKKAVERLEAGYVKAREIYNDSEKVNELLLKLGMKLDFSEIDNEENKYIHKFYQVVRKYSDGEIIDISEDSMIYIISALTYFISPLDAIPDLLPGIGHIDDFEVIEACYEKVKDEM